MKRLLVLLLLLLLPGCAIADKSDKFGADLEFSIGGILSYVVDVNFKASVGFSKTCKECEHEKTIVDPVDADWRAFYQRRMRGIHGARLGEGDSSRLGIREGEGP